MSKQTIISISREFGSAGHEIAMKIAEDLGMKLYDRSILDEIANQMNVKVELLEKFDEQPRNFIMSRRVGAYSNSMEEILAEIQFDFIRKKAEEGESFVIVGRCSEVILKDYEGLISIFVTADREYKKKRVKEVYHLSDADAIAKMERHDKKRKRYHNRHSETKWGDSRCYDICINSSRLGIDKTAEALEAYIKDRMITD
ncbi:MAG: cytidylate kinase-like family protein [Clostridia bacterium]|nr:cytidylate kinase-like family protein [Clostridia bacterium]